MTLQSGNTGTIASGAGLFAGGSLNIKSGNSGSGTGGAVNITAGYSGDLTGAYTAGAVSIVGGSGNGTGIAAAMGGAISIVGGFGGTTGATTGGQVSVKPGVGNTASGGTNGAVVLQTAAGTDTVRVQDNGTTAQLGFFNVTPILRPATSITGTAPVINSGTALNTGTTFEGYTLAQVVTALKALGLLT